MEYRHIVFHEARLIYTSVPKSANTSVKTALMETFVPEFDRTKRVHGDHGLFEVVRERDLPHKYLDYFRFTVVRNPFDRFVSFFVQKIAKRRKVNPSLQRVGFEHGMTFADACRLVAELPDHGANPHYRSQHVVIAPEGRLIPSYIARIESLADEWATITAIVAERSGIRLANLPHRTRSKHRPYQKYYDRRSRRLVTRRYEDDLKLLGYRYER